MAFIELIPMRGSFKHGYIWVNLNHISSFVVLDDNDISVAITEGDEPLHVDLTLKEFLGLLHEAKNMGSSSMRTIEGHN